MKEITIGIKRHYLKCHYELNHIEYLWYDRKIWIKRNYKYSIEKLRNDISKALAQVKRSAISLGHYKSCLKKIDLYREKIQYRTSKCMKFISHKKTWVVNNDR